MSRIHSQYQLQVPATLKNQLLDFRRRVWTTKMTEAAGVAVFSLAFIFLCVFALDRLWDTPVWMRFGALILALAGCMVAPFYFHRWVWRHRRWRISRGCSVINCREWAIGSSASSNFHTVKPNKRVREDYARPRSSKWRKTP